MEGVPPFVGATQEEVVSPDWFRMPLTCWPEPEPATAVRDVGQVFITPGYFRVMGVPLERGRLFDGRDQGASEAVAVVNEALVRKYFAGADPIGRHIRQGR